MTKLSERLQLDAAYDLLMLAKSQYLKYWRFESARRSGEQIDEMKAILFLREAISDALMGIKLLDDHLEKNNARKKPIYNGIISARNSEDTVRAIRLIKSIKTEALNVVYDLDNSMEPDYGPIVDVCKSPELFDPFNRIATAIFKGADS